MGLNLNQYGWEKVQAVEPGDFTSIPAGAYVCKIVDARSVSIKDKGLQLVLDIDIAEGEFAGHFAQRKGPDGSWSFHAQFKRYLVKKNSEGRPEITSQFKGLIKMLERQNPSFKYDTNDFNAESLRGLICGFIFGEEEYIDKKTGDIKTSVRIKFAADVEKVRAGEVKIPALEKIYESQRPDKQSYSSEFDGSDVPDADLPF